MHTNTNKTLLCLYSKLSQFCCGRIYMLYLHLFLQKLIWALNGICCCALGCQCQPAWILWYNSPSRFDDLELS